MNRPANDFWSRRKAKVAAEAEVEEPLADDVPQEELSDEEILAKFDLPDPDTIKLGDDIKGFMSKAVPERLRRRALRKLWRTNPVLACLDGLNDYDDDFTDFATVMPDIQTTYQVGKGMLAHLEYVARKADVLQTMDENADVGFDQEEEPADLPDVEVATPQAETSVAKTTDDQTEAAPQPASRRRMKLQFDQDAPSEVCS